MNEDYIDEMEYEEQVDNTEYYEKETKKLERKIERLEQDYREAYTKGYACCLRHNKSIFERIDKAIEYIEKQWYSINTTNINDIVSLGNWKLDLLSILRGEDNE